MRYECEIKYENRWVFLGWYEIKRDEFEAEYKENNKFIYQTKKYLNGDVEYYRFRK